MVFNYTPFQITKNFHSDEFKCNDFNQTAVPYPYIFNMIYLATQLQKIRDYLNIDLLKINSGYRTKFHNSKIGGADNSNHLTASASDLVQFQYTNKQFYEAILELAKAGLIPKGEIIYYDSFVHYAPIYDNNHLPQKHEPLYKDLEKQTITYNKDINHAKFTELQKIRQTFHKIKTN